MNYPSQEELLNDVASLMQQMRRFKIDCEAKSDPKTEGRQVKTILTKRPFSKKLCSRSQRSDGLGKRSVYSNLLRR